MTDERDAAKILGPLLAEVPDVLARAATYSQRPLLLDTPAPVDSQTTAFLDLMAGCPNPTLDDMKNFTLMHSGSFGEGSLRQQFDEGTRGSNRSTGAAIIAVAFQTGRLWSIAQQFREVNDAQG